MRLSRITTKTGDKGDTGLADGSRLPKQALEMECLGTQDELLCQLGLIIAALPDDKHLSGLREAQQGLFGLGAELAMPGYSKMTEKDIDWLTAETGRLNEALPPLKEFILPGPPEVAARTHMARALCRRLERRCWALQSEKGGLNPHALVWLNRLSDWLFVLARTFTQADGQIDPQWQKD